MAQFCLIPLAGLFLGLLGCTPHYNLPQCCCLGKWCRRSCWTCSVHIDSWSQLPSEWTTERRKISSQPLRKRKAPEENRKGRQRTLLQVEEDSDKQKSVIRCALMLLGKCIFSKTRRFFSSSLPSVPAIKMAAIILMTNAAPW